jgi:hypothetical protein
MRRIDSGTEITVRVPRGEHTEGADADDAQLDLRLHEAKPPVAKVKRGKRSKRTEKA